MKIGELFVQLGFKGDARKVDEFGGGLQNAKMNALAFKAAIAATGFAVFKFTESITKYSVELKNFAIQTGLSVQELEKWRYAAEMNDVTGEELISTIKNIQSAQTEIKLGGGNVRPWQLLGIDPNENPFQVLESVRARIKDLDPAIASSILGQMGIGQNFINVLKAGSLEFDKLNKKFLLTEKETQSLLELNKAFKDMLFSLRGIRNRIGAISAKPLQDILRAVKNAATAILDFSFYIRDLFNQFSMLRNIVLAVAIGIGLYFAPITSIIVGIIAVIDDLYVYLNGGKSVIGGFVDVFTKGIQKIRDFLQPLIDMLLKAVDLIKLVSNPIGKVFGDVKESLNNPIFGTQQGSPNVSNMLSKSNTTNNNSIEINVNGSGSPEETARSISDRLQSELNQAYYQTPVSGIA